MLLLKAVTCDGVLSVLVHLSTAAIRPLRVFATAAEKPAQVLIPNVQVKEGPVAVDHRLAVLEGVSKLLFIGFARGIAWVGRTIIFHAFLVVERA